MENEKLPASKIASWLKIAGIDGIIAPIYALTLILISVASYPQFSWTDNALSDLGVVSGVTSALFQHRVNYQRRFVPSFRNRPSRATVQYCYWQSWSVSFHLSLLGAFVNRSFPRKRGTCALSVFCKLLRAPAHFHASYRSGFLAHQTKTVSGFHIVDRICCRGTLGPVVFCSIRSRSSYSRVCVCSCRRSVDSGFGLQDDYGSVTCKSSIVRFYWFVKISALQFTSKCFDWQRPCRFGRNSKKKSDVSYPWLSAYLMASSLGNAMASAPAFNAKDIRFGAVFAFRSHAP